jgi:hypothetical protein
VGKPTLPACDDHSAGDGSAHDPRAFEIDVDHLLELAWLDGEQRACSHAEAGTTGHVGQELDRAEGVGCGGDPAVDLVPARDVGSHGEGLLTERLDRVHDLVELVVRGGAVAGEVGERVGDVEAGDVGALSSQPQRRRPADAPPACRTGHQRHLPGDPLEHGRTLVGDPGDSG